MTEGSDIVMGTFSKLDFDYPPVFEAQFVMPPSLHPVQVCIREAKSSLTVGARSHGTEMASKRERKAVIYFGLES